MISIVSKFTRTMWAPKLLTSLCIFSLITFSESHNILVLFPHIGKSHFMVYENLFKTLAQKGHNVTVVSFFPQKQSVPNYRDITISADGEMTGMGLLSLDMFGDPRQVMYTGADLVADMADSTCKHFLSHPNLQSFLKENNSFDLVLVEMFNTNCHLGVAHKFKAPIIGHPNVKVFITHGGVSSSLEAMHCGIPVIVIPQLADQYSNAAAIEANGNGVKMLLKEATEERILENLRKVLTHEFRMQVKSQSERYKDRPLPPMETALYWIEYVIRHKGANFMRTAAVGMPFYQYHLLDVIAFIVFVLCSLTFIIYKVLTLVFRLMFHKKRKVKEN